MEENQYKCRREAHCGTVCGRGTQVSVSLTLPFSPSRFHSLCLSLLVVVSHSVGRRKKEENKDWKRPFSFAFTRCLLSLSFFLTCLHERGAEAGGTSSSGSVRRKRKLLLWLWMYMYMRVCAITTGESMRPEESVDSLSLSCCYYIATKGARLREEVKSMLPTRNALLTC